MPWQATTARWGNNSGVVSRALRMVSYTWDLTPLHWF